MNRDEAFELQLARWLEEGPVRAPGEPVAAALARVRAHPARRRTEGRWWTRAMCGMTLTNVPGRQNRGWLAVVAATILVVVGVGGFGLIGGGIGGGVDGGGTPTPADTPQPTPTIVPTPTPASELATGRETCTQTSPGVTSTIDGVVETRDQVFACTDTDIDPRLTGESTITMNTDEHPGGAWLAWGTVELANDGGAWNGYYVIATTVSASTMEFDGVWLGSGGYEGLESVHHVVTSAGASTLTSRVFEAGSAITGTETCATTADGTTITVGEITASRGVELRCSDAMADARVSGQRSITVAIDTRPDRGADLWGRSTVTNQDGAWDGMFFGTVDPGYSTHHLRGLMRGSGDYAGLIFRLDVTGTGNPTFELAGEIISRR